MDIPREQPTFESVYGFIQEFTKEHGFSPTVREIAKGCFLGLSTTLRCLDKLEGLKRISREPNKARSIVLLADEASEKKGSNVRTHDPSQ
jgi:SOS-response transcriptional repressor LexA